MAQRVVVIGSGPGGYVAAIRAAQLGFDVKIVEKSLAGGTCLNRGCIPTKVLVSTAQLLDKMRRAGEYGIKTGEIQVNMEQVMRRKDKVVEYLRKGLLQLFKSHNIEVINGEAYFRDKNTIGVRSEDNDDAEINFDYAIIATGTVPADLPGLNRDGKYILNSDDMMQMRELPESVLIVGAGYIGTEFAFIFNSLGSEVHLVEILDRPMATEDPDVVKLLEREMKKRKTDGRACGKKLKHPVCVRFKP